MSNAETTYGKQYLITISTRQHKIVKFIDSDNRIKAQKLFFNDLNNQGLHMLILTQLLHIQHYVMRKQQCSSLLQIHKYLAVEEKLTKDASIIKVTTQFKEYPNLYDFYRRLPYQQSRQSLNSQKPLLFYIQQFFQLIVGAGGIPNYFYTPNNFFIIPPNSKVKIIEISMLTLNLTSTAGLKFFSKNSKIVRAQFYQIFPCIPPNAYTLLEQGKLDQLNVLIKIRCFAYNVLLFILKRIPQLLEQNISTLVNPWDQSIRKMVNGSADTFSKLLNLESQAIKKASQHTKVDLWYFFKRVLIQNSIDNWNQVYDIVFLQNYFNLGAYQRIRTPDKQYDIFRLDQICSDKITKLVWELEDQEGKEYWKKLGIATEEGGGLYLMLKINGNIHKHLRYANIVQLIKNERFSPDVDFSVKKLIQLLTQAQQNRTTTDRATFKNIQEAQKFIKDLLDSRIQNPQNDLSAQEYLDLFNPAILDHEKWLLERSIQEGSLLLTPYSFMSNAGTFPFKKVNNQEFMSSNMQLEALGSFGDSLWLV